MASSLFTETGRVQRRPSYGRTDWTVCTFLESHPSPRLTGQATRHSPLTSLTSPSPSPIEAHVPPHPSSPFPHCDDSTMHHHTPLHVTAMLQHGAPLHADSPSMTPVCHFFHFFFSTDMTPQCCRSPCKLCIASLLTPRLKCTLPILTRAAARLHHTRRQHDGDAGTHAPMPILCIVCAVFFLHSHAAFLSSQINLAHRGPTRTPAQMPACLPSRPHTHAAEQGSVVAASPGTSTTATHARPHTCTNAHARIQYVLFCFSFLRFMSDSDAPAPPFPHAPSAR